MIGSLHATTIIAIALVVSTLLSLAIGWFIDAGKPDDAEHMPVEKEGAS